MKTSSIILILTSLLLCGSLFAANTITVRLVGTGAAYDGNPLFESFGLSPQNAACFDLDLVDVKTNRVIGAASDCLSDISPSASDDGLMLTGTTFFFFPGGTLISQGLTTVQPVLHGSPNFTHITGAIPSPGENGVIFGDGRFRHAAGPVRLSGTVNLSDLDSAGLITFDCVFILEV